MGSKRKKGKKPPQKKESRNVTPTNLINPKDSLDEILVDVAKLETQSEDNKKEQAIKDWTQTIYVLIPVVIGVGTSAVGVFWSSNRYIAVWITFVALSLTIYLSFYLLKSFIWSGKMSWILEVLLLILCSIWHYQTFKNSGSPYEITQTERESFITKIASLSPPREEIRLGCAANDEKSCLIAGEFLNLFQEAGWVVRNNKVERVVLSKPKAGIVLMKRGETQEEPPPGFGVWVAQTPSLLYLVDALSGINITAERSADAQMPEGVIGFFVGPEPRN